MAPLTEDDRTLIRILRIEKHLNGYQMINEFAARNWSKNNLNRLIRQILKGRKHFTQNVMVSVAVSNLGKTAPFFVTPKAKVNACTTVMRYLDVAYQMINEFPARKAYCQICV